MQPPEEKGRAAGWAAGLQQTAPKVANIGTSTNVSAGRQCQNALVSIISMHQIRPQTSNPPAQTGEKGASRMKAIDYQTATAEEKTAQLKRVLDGSAPVVSPTDAALVLDCAPRTVARMCETGKLKAVKVMSMWRINRAALLAFIGYEDASATETATANAEGE